MERVIMIMVLLNMKDIGVMIIDLELESCMIDQANLWKNVSGLMELKVILKIIAEMAQNQWISKWNIWNWLTNVHWLIGMFLGYWIWNQSKLAMDVLNQCKHSESKDWIDWKRSKSARIHLLKVRMMLEMMNRNHSTYWIVNHWNPLKLVNIVSVILLATLNWRIYHNYNPFKLGQLEENHPISIGVPLWFEVLNWYWTFEWLDLPNLHFIGLGDYAFCESLSTIMESIKWIWMKWFE